MMRNTITSIQDKDNFKITQRIIIGMSRGKQSNLQKLMQNRKRKALPEATMAIKSAKLIKSKIGDKELDARATMYATWLGKKHRAFGPVIRLDLDNPDPIDWLIDVDKNRQPVAIHFRKTSIESNPRSIAYATALGMGYGLFPAFAKLDEQEQIELLKPLFVACGNNKTIQNLYQRVDVLDKELASYEEGSGPYLAHKHEHTNIVGRLETPNLIISAYLNWIIWEPNSLIRGEILQHLFDREDLGLLKTDLGNYQRNQNSDIINVSQELIDGFNHYHSNPILIWPQSEWQTIRPEFLKSIEKWLY